MKCAEARDAMLAADPSALAGAGNTPLATHLRECDRCARSARALALELDVLAAELGRRSSRHIRRVALAIAVPIAAGAVLMLAWRSETASTMDRVPSPAVVSVQVDPGQTAAVITTKDPKVTVVWLTTEGGAP